MEAFSWGRPLHTRTRRNFRPQENFRNPVLRYFPVSNWFSNQYSRSMRAPSYRAPRIRGATARDASWRSQAPSSPGETARRPVFDRARSPRGRELRRGGHRQHHRPHELPRSRARSRRFERACEGRRDGPFAGRRARWAQRYRFPAPAGIVDHRLRRAGDELVLSLVSGFADHGGPFVEVDAQRPLVAPPRIGGGLDAGERAKRQRLRAQGDQGGELRPARTPPPPTGMRLLPCATSTRSRGALGSVLDPLPARSSSRNTAQRRRRPRQYRRSRGRAPLRDAGGCCEGEWTRSTPVTLASRQRSSHSRRRAALS